MKKLLIIVSIILVLAVVAGIGIWKYGANVLGIPTVPAKEGTIALDKDDRLLIIAPHPDDETLGPGSLAEEARGLGAKVKAVVITTGDGYKHAVQVNLDVENPTAADYRSLAEMRHKESVEAMGILGVKDVVFLGYADGSINSLWRESWDPDQAHLGLNGSTTVPYDFAYQPGAVYCGQSLSDNLSSIIKEYKPTIIVYPCPEDMHHDHWAVNAFTQYVLARDNVKTREYTYLVHRGSRWPSPPLYSPDKPMDPPYQLGEVDATWIRYKTAGSKKESKLQAVKAYKTQNKMPRAAVFLAAFVRINELYALYPDLVFGELKVLPASLSTNSMPGTVITDYEQSELSKSLGGKGDIRKIAAVTDDKDIELIVELATPLSDDLVLMINTRIFSPDGVRRLDIKVNGGQAVAVKAAADSVEPEGGIKFMKKDKRIAVRFNDSVFNGATTVMFNVDTFRSNTTEDEWLDRTAWRRLALQ